MKLHFRMVDPLAEDFVREFLLASTVTFYDFYRFLCDQLDLPSDLLMSFYVVDEAWEKTMEITLMNMEDSDAEIPLVEMNSVTLADVCQHPGQRLIFCYDLFLNRTLYLQYLREEEGSVDLLPGVCIKSQGENPKPSPSMEGTVLDDIRELSL